MIEEKNNEISLLKKDLSQAKTYIEQQKVINCKSFLKKIKKKKKKIQHIIKNYKYNDINSINKQKLYNI